MYYLVEGALQEGGVYCHDRLEALCRQSGGKGDGMLFADAHVEDTPGEFSLDYVQAIPLGHSRSDRHQFRVFLRQAQNGLGKHLAVAGYYPGGGAFRRHAVKVDGVALGGEIALALGGDNVDEGRLGAVVSCSSQSFFQLGDVVSVNRPHVGEAELFPEYGGDNQAPEAFDEPLARLPQLSARGES
ncbi:hypothetical protein ES703_28015 [subsurface metagenome]